MPRILLIEDSEADGALLQYAAETAGISLQLRQERSGELGLDALREELANTVRLLVLLDLNLPGINGIDVLKRIRADNRTAHVPVLVLTSSKRRSDVLECYREKANAYLEKPFGLSAYLPVVRSLHEFWFRDAVLPYDV